MDDLNETLKKFWSVENEGLSETKTQMSLDEKKALDIVKESLVFNGIRYEVAIPWKKDHGPIISNYQMATKSLECTERKLAKNQCSSKDYEKIIHEYMAKGYIRRIPSEEKEPKSC